MASHSFSSLKDMLKSSSSSSSSTSSTPQAEAIEEINGITTNLPAMFHNQVSVKESCSSVSFIDSLTPPVLSSSSSSLSHLSTVDKNPMEQIISSSCGKNPVVSSKVKELNKYPKGRSWCVKPGGPWTSRNVFPPPITCLKSIKNGKPYAYMKFNEDDQSFVVEEIKIPSKDFMRASRSDGRLKLYYVVSDDEASEMEDERERAETTDDEQDCI